MKPGGDWNGSRRDLLELGVCRVTGMEDEDEDEESRLQGTEEACETGVEAESGLGGEGPDICQYLPVDKVVRGPVAVLNSSSSEIVEYLG